MKTKCAGTMGVYTPIIFIHGLWGNSLQWSDWHRKFPGRNTHAIDLIGHGSRLEKVDRLSMMDYTEEAIKQIEMRSRTSLDHKMILVGHSAGGLIAQMVAYMRPDLVEQVILLASCAPRSARARIPTQKSFLKMWLFKAIITGNECGIPLDEEKVVVGDVNMHLGKESGTAVRQVLMHSYDVPPSIDVPFTVIAPTRDQLQPRAYQECLAAYIGTELLTSPGNHMFHTDPKVNHLLIEKVGRILQAQTLFVSAA